MDEIEKYRRIYESDSPRWSRYGHSNHGRDAMPIVLGLAKERRSVIDVGCGYNEFAEGLREVGFRAVGVDFACPGADMIADAKRLPFAAKTFQVVTAFDMLEHLREEEVAPVLREFSRVAECFCFSVAYWPSRYRVEGETLHPCVHPEAWWIAAIRAAGGEVEKTGRYLHGRWIDGGAAV